MKIVHVKQQFFSIQWSKIFSIFNDFWKIFKSEKKIARMREPPIEKKRLKENDVLAHTHKHTQTCIYTYILYVRLHESSDKLSHISTQHNPSIRHTSWYEYTKSYDSHYCYFHQRDPVLVPELHYRPWSLKTMLQMVRRGHHRHRFLGEKQII